MIVEYTHAKEKTQYDKSQPVALQIRSRGQSAPKFHVGFQKFQKMPFKKLPKWHLKKKITSALAMETSLGLDFLEVLFLF